MKKNNINIVLSANNPGSITRLAAEYANRLVEMDFKVIISYPFCDHFDFRLWQANKKMMGTINGSLKLLGYYNELLRVILHAIYRHIVRTEYRKWIGKSLYNIDKRVKENCYFCTPSGFNMPDADFIIVMQEYLIPHLLYLPKSRGRVIGSIHLDYEEGMKDSSKVLRDWWSFVVSIDKRVNIPLWVTSRGTKKSCDKLGIKVGKIIYNGIDTDKLADGQRRGKLDPLRIMLYCDPKPQKGLSFGCAVIKRLKQTLVNNEVTFCSLGKIGKKDSELFDINFGYLKGDDYINAFQEGDVLVYPSLYDGFPAPPLDAMACGCALATTRVQGVEEYGIHMTNCMIAEPEDEDKMVNNIKRLIDDVSLRDRIRENGLLTAKKFSWENATNELVDFILEEALSK